MTTTRPMAATASRARPGRWLLALAAVGVLAGCGGGPAQNISLIPGNQIEAQSRRDGLFVQPVKWQHTKPGCQGECPSIKLESLVFPSVPRLTQLVDHALAMMTGVNAKRIPPYSTVAGYEEYFWKTAAPRDSTMLSAKARYRSKYLTVIELDTWQYLTGAAHGLSATQFLNWDNSRQGVLSLDQVLLPGKHQAYVEALRAAHQRWLASNPDARHDPATYNRLWPFQPSDNYAFSDDGLVVKYDSYQIAPYSAGQPELRIPYAELAGILKPEYLPSASR
nr:RsiV family protein [Candidimonas nitroreducens]